MAKLRNAEVKVYGVCAQDNQLLLLLLLLGVHRQRSYAK
jgi:hypothetical protein